LLGRVRSAHFGDGIEGLQSVYGRIEREDSVL